MNETLQARCDLLAANRMAVRRALLWEYDVMAQLGGVIFTAENAEADTARLKECKKLLRKNAGAFSQLRGMLQAAVISKMALADDPLVYLDGIKAVYEQVKKGHVLGGSELLLTAMTVYDRVGSGEEAAAAAETARALLARMRREHPLLTGREDLPMAAILSLSGMDTDLLVEKMETAYKPLKRKFHAPDAVQSLSHVLALADDGAPQRVAALYDGLKKSRHRYGRGPELALLGTLVMLDLPTEQLVGEIIAAELMLKQKKGFGVWHVTRQHRRMYAAMLVLQSYLQDPALSEDVAASHAVALAVAADVAVMIVVAQMMAAAAAASAAASSSSGS